MIGAIALNIANILTGGDPESGHIFLIITIPEKLNWKYNSIMNGIYVYLLHKLKRPEVTNNKNMIFNNLYKDE